MAKNNGINFNIEISPQLYDYFNKEAPQRLQEARKNVVEAAGMAWADEAKEITTNENHIDTGLYVNSIGYVTGSPASESDVINQLKELDSKTTLKTGSSVGYAAALEKRYSIMARGLDRSKGRMQNIAKAQVEKSLRL